MQERDCADRIGEEGEMGCSNAAAQVPHNLRRNQGVKAKTRRRLDGADGRVEQAAHHLRVGKVEARVGRGTRVLG